MSASVDQTFITKFQSEISHDFQQMGTKLKDTVYNVQANSSVVRFPTLGTIGVETNKPRHADVTPQDVAHSYVEATLSNYHTGQYIDDLDELKTNQSIRSAYIKAMTSALGRKVDNILLTELNTTSNNANASAAAIDNSLLSTLRYVAGENDWRDQENSWWIALDPISYSKLLTVTEVMSSDYSMGVTWNEGRIARVLGFNVVEISGLNTFRPSAGVDDTLRTGFMWHTDAVGLAVGSEIKTSINYVPQKDSWFVMGKMSMAAKQIQTEGVHKIQIDYDA